jgi:membrane associated rhomboid family serine protease
MEDELKSTFTEEQKKSNETFRKKLKQVLFDLAYKLPVIYLHLIFPTLASFPFKELDLPPPNVEWFVSLVRSLSPHDLFTEKFIKSLVLKKENSQYTDSLQDFLNYRIITRLLIHNDFQHMLNNLIHLLLVSDVVAWEFGGLFYYFVFVGGGILSSVPLFRNIIREMKKSELENRPSDSIRDILVPRTGSGERTGSSSNDPINKILLPPKKPNHGWRNMVETLLGKPQAKGGYESLSVDRSYVIQSCGSSAAVFSVWGACFIVNIKETVRLLHSLYRRIVFSDVEEVEEMKKSCSTNYYQENSKADRNKVPAESSETAMTLTSNNNNRSKRKAPFILLDILRLFFHTGYIINAVTYLNWEYRCFSDQQVFSHPMLTPPVSINHEAHLQGFLFGSVMAVVRYWQLRSRKLSETENKSMKELS